MNSWSIKKTILFILGLDALVMALIFSVAGFFNTSVDSILYIAQIEGFSGRGDLLDPLIYYQFLKPMYGVVGSWLGFILNPHGAILLLNILFFFGVTLCFYGLLRKMSFNNSHAFIGSAWFVTAYPMLKYGLALGTDISGWFFAVVTILFAFYAFQYNSLQVLTLVSLVGFLGSLTKETGALGLVFTGVYILMQIGAWPRKKVFVWLATLCLPFAILEAVFLYIVSLAGGPTFLSWLGANQGTYGPEFHSAFFFVGVLGSTFSVLLVFALIGLIRAFMTREVFTRTWLSIYGSLFIASLPVLMWPIFISRILFIQFIFVIPLALSGFVWLEKKYGILVALIPPVVSIGLFLLSGTGSLVTRIFG